MSAIYRAARTAFLTGDIDMGAAVVQMTMVGPGYVFDESHADLGDLTATIGTAMTVTITDVTDGEVHCEPVTFVAIPDGSTIAGLVTYMNASGLLVAYADRRADAVPLNPLAGTGGDLTFHFPDYLLKI